MSTETREELREALDAIRGKYLPPDARSSLLQHARYYMSHDDDCEPMGPLGCTCLMLVAREALDAVDALLATLPTAPSGGTGWPNAPTDATPLVNELERRLSDAQGRGGFVALPHAIAAQILDVLKPTPPSSPTPEVEG